MSRPPRRSPLQLELFAKDTVASPPGTPAWSALPDQTRHALTALVTRMLIAHASDPAMVSEDDDDDL